MEFAINQTDLNNLRQAISRNPGMVLSETRKFLQRGIASYMRTIGNNPWRLGGKGGGSPIATGNLKSSHRHEIGTWEAKITPTAKYAIYVHEGTRKMEGRPWLDYTEKVNQSEIDKLQVELLDNIVKDLAR